MAAKIEFSKNYKKISFADISEISPKTEITCHQETIENLKNRGNFPESCPLKLCYQQPDFENYKRDSNSYCKKCIKFHLSSYLGIKIPNGSGVLPLSMRYACLAFRTLSLLNLMSSSEVSVMSLVE